MVHSHKVFTSVIKDGQWYEFPIDSGLQIVTEYMSQDDKGNFLTTYTYKYIANFWPEVLACVEVDNNGVTTLFVKLVLHFPDDTDDTESKPVVVELKGLGKISWPDDIDLRCVLAPEVPKATEHIANIIRTAVYNAPVEKMTVINRLGTHIIDGIPVFCTGDRLIWPKGIEHKPAVKWNALPNVRLAVDPNCTEQEVDAGMMRIIDLNAETGRIIFALNLLSIQRGAFIFAGIKPRCCLFIHGPTGNKKTTYAAFQSQIYNRDEPLVSLVRLNASIPAAVKLLYEKDDCVVVLDDLFPAQDSEIHRQQEKTLLEITRIVADGIEPARMRGKELAKAPPRSSVLFTGEYYIGSGSDAARLFPVKMATPISNDRMTACQQEPLILSTFYNNYLEWYISNFANICALLKEWLAVYRSTRSEIHPRLQESQFCLEAAYKLYLTYRLEKGFISKDTMLDQYHSFYHQIRSIVKEQNARVNQGVGGKPRRVDYLALIRSLYRDCRFRLVESVKDFEAKEHDGIIRGDYLYLRRDRLMMRIRTCEPSAEFDAVLMCLKEQQAIKTGSSSNSRKIGGSRLRFYAVKLSSLR